MCWSCSVPLPLSVWGLSGREIVKSSHISSNCAKSFLPAVAANAVSATQGLPITRGCNGYASNAQAALFLRVHQVCRWCLYEILLAGEWRGPAFMRYLIMVEREAGAVVQAQVDVSSSEEVDAS